LVPINLKQHQIPSKFEGTSPSSTPIVLISRLFRKPKIVETTGKGGSKLNPIPLTGADATVVDKGKDGEASGDAMRDRFGAGR